MNIKLHVLFCIIIIGLMTHFILERTNLQTTGDNLDYRRSHTTMHNGSYPCHNRDFIPVHKKAVWTMLTDDPHYVLSALKLGHSLRTHTNDTRFDMVAIELSTKPLDNTAWDCLREMGWKRCVVDRIMPVYEEAIRMYEPRFLDQFTKLHLWDMTMYDTLLYLDSDTITLRSIRHLLYHNLGNKSIAAAAQIWHGMFQGFNMGVFVIHPSKHEYKRLLTIQQDPSVQYERHWAEQGFMNVVYKDKWDDLGFTNNALAWMSWQSNAYWIQNYPVMNIIHYVGLKPWTCVPDAFEQVLLAQSAHYTPVCQLWKNIPTQYKNQDCHLSHGTEDYESLDKTVGVANHRSQIFP